MSTLTNKQIAQNAAGYIAAMTGKPWQYVSKYGSGWRTAEPYNEPSGFLKDGYLIRPAPEPTPENPQRAVHVSVTGVQNNAGTQCNWITTAVCADGSVWWTRDTDSEWHPFPSIPCVKEAKP